MSDYIECYVCKKMFKKSQLSTFFSGATAGLSDLGHKYCSKVCKNLDKGIKEDSKSSRKDVESQSAPAIIEKKTEVVNQQPGFGHFLGKTLNESVNKSLSLNDKFDQEDRERALRIEDLSSLRLSSDSDELLDQMNYLSSIGSSNSDKSIKNVVIEKMEFGILKLSKLGLTEEALFFEKKLEPLKKKGWF